MNTLEYRTRTIFAIADNPKTTNNLWPIGLDIGYSAVKFFSGNSYGCFPSFAKKSSNVEEIRIGNLQNDPTIKYRDENGDVWIVGEVAQNTMTTSDTSDSSMSLYGRNRYYNPMFKVIARVGIAAASRTNVYGNPSGKQIKVMTGLPPKYIRSDSASLKEALQGHHSFDIAFGSEPFQHFEFDIATNDVMIMDQPMGTLFSIASGPDFSLVPEAQKYFSSKVLIVDPGFGTLDTFPVIMRQVDHEKTQTFDNLGMKRVLQETSEEIAKRYNNEIPVPAMQKYLETGTVVKKEGMKRTKVAFDDILKECSKKICNEMLDRIVEIYDPTMEYDYIVVTGGTGAAWSNFIAQSEYFVGSDTVKIIPGNAGDRRLEYLFSNVRGYYVMIYGQCAAMAA